PSITLNWDNLELLCEACHREEHARRRWRADESGHVELPLG
ncbi:MAG: HNH endonuclease, partial [Clostridia bacterium]|nr:HNH endonuclease [Clostridia bacterium]